MKIGYARVSTLAKGQSTDPQEARLRADGCQVLFTDTGQSGMKASRPGWNACQEFLQAGDTLVSVRLDRFGRSVQHLYELSADMRKRGIALRCLDQGIDTSTPAGRLFFGMLAVFAEFEHDILVERTLDGLATAREQGKIIGAPRALTIDQERIVGQLHAGGMKPAEIAATMNTSVRTVYRVLSRAQEPVSA